MTENNLGNIKPGDEAAIVLDVLPGEVLKGRVRSVGSGVGSRQASASPARCRGRRTAATGCARRSAFPVAVEFDPSERERLRGVRIGGQADVLVYTGTTR